MNTYLSLFFTNHRWLLSPIPFLLMLLGAVTLFVYRERIGDHHAREYQRVVSLSVWGSVATLFVIALESLL